MKDYPRRPLWKDPNTATPYRFALFTTVAGPDDAAYPAEGDGVRLYYARKLRDVQFSPDEAAGVSGLVTDSSDDYEFIFDLGDGYQSEGAVVLCFELYDRWFIPAGGSGGVCEPQDELQLWTMFGRPTGGSISVRVKYGTGADDVRTLAYNATKTLVQAAFPGTTCDGGPWPDAAISIRWPHTAARLPREVLPSHAGLTGGSAFGLNCARWQQGIAE